MKGILILSPFLPIPIDLIPQDMDKAVMQTVLPTTLSWMGMAMVLHILETETVVAIPTSLRFLLLLLLRLLALPFLSLWFPLVPLNPTKIVRGGSITPK